MNEKLNNICLCRCCLSSNCYKDLHNEYYYGGRTENYSNMLFDVFNLNISNNEITKNLICEECIAKIREAVAFKEQVLNTEKTFLQHLRYFDHEISSDQEPIKVENDINEINKNQEDFDDKIGDDCLADGRNLFWQDEDISVERDKLFMGKSGPKRECTGISLRNNHSKSQTARNKIIKKGPSNTTVIKKPIKRAVQVKQAKTIVIKKSSTKSQINQRENTLKLILNSNMCLFTSYRTKYGCYMCKERFLNIKELRKHTMTHMNEKYLVSRVKHLRGLSYKNVDISNLTCKLCSSDSQNLLDLQHHLTVSHDMTFDGSEHFLIPYKLETGLECVVCGQNFNTFLRLSIHMNTHSTNNVCEICGVSYINRMSLRLHVQSLHREKKCTLCPLVFLTNSSRTRHMRKTHNHGTYKRHCLLCEKTFRYTYMLVEHNIEAHGAERQTCLCPDCGKSFPTQQNLKIHVRGVHIKERNYPCGVCDMRFFTRFDQRRHERTHEETRAFSCTFCETKFKTKDSWRRHLKRQHGHYVNNRVKTLT